MSALYDIALTRVREQFPRVFFFRPNVADVPAGTVLGGTVWSKLHYARWVLNDALHLGNGVMQTDIARAWIEKNVRLPVRRKYADKPPAWAPLPLLSRRGFYEDVAYVDIVQTYKTILSTAGFDVEYRQGRWLSRGESRDGLDELGKVAYSAIVALSARVHKHVLIKRDERVESVTMYNKYANVALYALVRDLLYAIYSDVVESIETFYANTDGFIVSMQSVDSLIDMLHNWGFVARVKRYGDCRVYGTGSFSFTNFRTRRISTVDSFTPLLDDESRKWLRTRWTRLVAARE